MKVVLKKVDDEGGFEEGPDDDEGDFDEGPDDDERKIAFRHYNKKGWPLNTFEWWHPVAFFIIVAQFGNLVACNA